MPSIRRSCCEDFSLALREAVDEEARWIVMNRFEVLGITSPSTDLLLRGVKEEAAGEADEPPNTSVEEEEEEEEGNDEPLMSGNGGEDLRAITDDELLAAWSALIVKWRVRVQSSSISKMPCEPTPEVALERSGAEFPLPRKIRQLVQRGIPDSLRVEIWQLMAGFRNIDADLTEVYRILLTKVRRYKLIFCALFSNFENPVERSMKSRLV